MKSPYQTVVLDYLAELADHLELVAELVRECTATGPACQEWLARLSEVHGQLGMIEESVTSGQAAETDGEP